MNMKITNLCKALLIVFLNLFTLPAFAWDRALDLGVGTSHDPNHTHYTNSGVQLSGDLYPIYRSVSETFYWTLNGTLAHWQTTEHVHNNLTAVALAAQVRAYVL